MYRCTIVQIQNNRDIGMNKLAAVTGPIFFTD